MSDTEESGAGVPLLEPLSPSASPPPTSGKRKRETQTEAASKRAAKRKKTKKPKDIDDEDLNVEFGLNLAIGRMDSRLLADLVAQRTKRFEKELSLVELEDRYIPGMGHFSRRKQRLIAHREGCGGNQQLGTAKES